MKSIFTSGMAVRGIDLDTWKPILTAKVTPKKSTVKVDVSFEKPEI